MLLFRTSKWWNSPSQSGETESDLALFRPTKSPRDGNAVNKAGRLVLRGKLNGRAVKVYEAANREHAHFIRSVSQHELLADCFPTVRHIRSRFLVVDWAKNRGAATPPALEELSRKLHETPLAGLPPSGFDYWHDLIRPRFVRAAELLEEDGLACQVIERVNHVWDTAPKCLMHPDLTPRNVVSTAHNRYAVVDNELLGIGGLPLLDLCNTAYAIGAGACTDYGTTYLALRGTHVDEDLIRSLKDAWLARIVGSCFVAANLHAASKILKAYRQGENILPLSI